MDVKILDNMRDDSALYNSRKRSGHCVRCGVKLSTGDGKGRDKFHCNACRSAKNRQYKAGLAEEARRRAAGLCVSCGKVLIGPESMYANCPECMEKAQEKHERKESDRGSAYNEIRQAAASLQETCRWLVMRARGIDADGMKTQCVDCPWLRRRTEHEEHSYCPSVSGTGPDTMDCLRYTTYRQHGKKRKREEQNE